MLKSGTSPFCSAQAKNRLDILNRRINISGNIVARSKSKFADYMLYLNDGKPIAVVEAKDNKDNLESAVEESANLLTRILRRCAELNKLPDVDNLAFRVDKQKQGIKCKILVP